MVRTRIAPSPTGDPHIGTAYAALFNYAFAKKNKGEFILRIEDTDRTRLVPESEQKIIDSLDWLGLKYDKGPIRQSERLKLYQQAAVTLVEKGKAYWCNCTVERLEKLRKEQQEKGEVPRYDRKCLNVPPKPPEKVGEGGFVVRLKVPTEGGTSFEDLIRGKITFANRDIDDAVLLKSDGWPTYHLAVVVDDNDMKITHVIRAEEWLSSTPKHILICEALGYEPSTYAHLPLLRNPDRSKISKRKDPVSLVWYKEQGYLPEALLNYLALMGWSMPDGREKFPLEDFVDNFDFGRVDPTGPVFDIQKLDWLNGEWIRSLDQNELASRLKEYTKVGVDGIKRVLPLVQERLKKLSEFDGLTSYIYADRVTLNKDLIIRKGKSEVGTVSLLKDIEKAFQGIGDWGAASIEGVLNEQVSKNPDWSKTDVFQTVRAVCTGTLSTPPLPDTLEAIGKEKTFSRIKSAVALLKES